MSDDGWIWLTCISLLSSYHKWSQSKLVHHLNYRAIFFKNFTNGFQVLPGNRLVQLGSGWRFVRCTDSYRFAPSASMPITVALHDPQTALVLSHRLQAFENKLLTVTLVVGQRIERRSARTSASRTSLVQLYMKQFSLLVVGIIFRISPFEFNAVVVHLADR